MLMYVILCWSILYYLVYIYYLGLKFSDSKTKVFNPISLNVPQDELMVVVVYAGLIISQAHLESDASTLHHAHHYVVVGF